MKQKVACSKFLCISIWTFRGLFLLLFFFFLSIRNARKIIHIPLCVSRPCSLSSLVIKLLYENNFLSKINFEKILPKIINPPVVRRDNTPRSTGRVHSSLNLHSSRQNFFQRKLMSFFKSHFSRYQRQNVIDAREYADDEINKTQKIYCDAPNRRV